MEFDKKNMTLEQAIAIIKEIEPQYESTKSGTAEGVILQAVHDSELAPVVRCLDCKFYREEPAKYRDNAVVVWCSAYRYPSNSVMPDDWFCAAGQRREK